MLCQSMYWAVLSLGDGVPGHGSGDSAGGCALGQSLNIRLCTLGIGATGQAISSGKLCYSAQSLNREFSLTFLYFCVSFVF